MTFFPSSSTAFKALLAGAFASVLLAGCSTSNDNPTGLTAQERAAATTNDQALPAPAQGRLAEQGDQNKQMNEMRAQDAAKAKAAGNP